jgi:hypothetical protein
MSETSTSIVLRVRAPTTAEELATYLDKNEPVIFTDLSEKWNARHWTIDKLVEMNQNVTTTITVSDHDQVLNNL